MTTPVKVPLTIYKGGVFKYRFIYTNEDASVINITGWSARMSIKDDFNGTVLISATSLNGRLILGGVTGTIDIKIPADVSALVEGDSGVYDLELIEPDGTVYKIALGKVKLVPEVTT